MSGAAERLAADGPLARAWPGWEPRPGQLEMARAVERALGEERILLCEAGTGTGKTLAYLVPAILSGKKVVISTATRALQDQIVGHDLPLVREALGLRPLAAVMKGLSNYVCRRRLTEFRTSSEAMRPAFAEPLGAVMSWLDETEGGDISELVSLEEGHAIWPEIVSGSETRIGSACRFHEECFVTQMKREAEAARLVIVNHHLFFADLALRGPHPAHVIPDYDAVIFDEAHQLEDVATTFFGLRVTSARTRRLAEEARRAFDAAGLGDPLFARGGGRAHADAVEASGDGFWKAVKSVAGGDGRGPLERDAWAGELADAWHRLDTALEGLGLGARDAAAKVKSAPSTAARGGRADPADALDVAGRRAEQLREDLATIADPGRGRVAWIDASGRSTAIGSAPVDLSSLLRERVFESVPAVVLTSATLTSGARAADDERPATGPFDYLRSRIGLGGSALDVTELVVGSPFEFEKRALLYLPRDLPLPRDPEFLAAAAARAAELIEVTGGGAFVLTTSLASMRALGRELRARCPGRRIAVQGEAPKAAQLAAFRAAGDAVQIATLGFWEGVDIPGDALRLVILEKIPFAVPSDPVVRARAESIQTEGGNAFLDYHVPAAAITLKQGFGRLIRTREDRGIVALFDVRVHERGYGEQLLGALPPARRATNLDELREFWLSCAR